MEERNTTVKQFFGMSQRGNLREAVRGLNNPQLIMLMSNSSQFEKHVRELEELYPQVPSSGCIGMCSLFGWCQSCRQCTRTSIGYAD